MANEAQPTRLSVPGVQSVARHGANPNQVSTDEDWLAARTATLRKFFNFNDDVSLINAKDDDRRLEVTRKSADYLEAFNLEWHVIPSADALPLDDAYFTRMYPQARRDFTQGREHALSYRETLIKGHRRQHQGGIIAVETTNKPRYLPGNRQYYGTPYGLDQTRDPFASYMGRAGLMSGTRFAHNYQAIQNFLRVVNDDWQRNEHLPQGFRFDICPPVVFNLIGTVFHTEWSASESLEMGFYTDEQGNAEVFAVGCSEAGDFSYINEVELETDWELLGFRLALVAEK